MSFKMKFATLRNMAMNIYQYFFKVAKCERLISEPEKRTIHDLGLSAR